MNVKVLYFGMIAERIGKHEEMVELVQTNSLRAYFCELYPQLEEMSFQVAINQEIKDSINKSEEVKEIALLPPFAGG